MCLHLLILHLFFLWFFKNVENSVFDLFLRGDLCKYFPPRKCLQILSTNQIFDVQKINSHKYYIK